MESQVERTINSLKETLKDNDLPIEVRKSIEAKIKALESKKEILK